MTYKPTDAELDALRQADNGDLNFVTLRQFRIIARAALAKWGSPVVAGEPKRVFIVATGEEHKGEETYTRYDASSPPLCDSECLYTTPQPTQVRAGAVPLTVDEIEQLIAQWSYELHGDRARYLVRMTEKHHGIKGGGQHAAN